MNSGALESIFLLWNLEGYHHAFTLLAHVQGVSSTWITVDGYFVTLSLHGNNREVSTVIQLRIVTV